MTKEKIIEIIDDNVIPNGEIDWDLDYKAIADELISLIEHEKKLLLAQIFVKISKKQVWYKSEIRDLAKEYGVKL